SVCVSMRNLDQISENVAAARNFVPLKRAEINALRDAYIASNPTLCADCTGQCSLAGGTKARLGDLTRYLTYYEGHGDRVAARKHYAALSDEDRDWKAADLAAARAACPSHLDFAKLMPKVDDLLA